MSRFWWLGVLVLWAAIVVMIRRRENSVSSSVQTPQTPSGADSDDGIDHEELEQAEREVKDLQQDVRGRPLDDVVGDDWGPGTPKPPYV